MAIYPAQIDTGGTNGTLPTAVDNFTSFNALFLNRLRDAILAIETELGIKPSGIYSTVRARLDTMDNTFIRIAGDIGGTATAPLVIGIQGRPVSSSQPAVGNALLWNGSSWVPSAVATVGTSSTIFAGDLSGTSSIQAVIGLQGRSLSSSAPTSGQVLGWNGSTWAPTTLTAGGDISGTLGSASVIKLQGFAVSATAPSSGQALEWNGSIWIPTTLTAGGDLSGTLGTASVVKLQGRTMSATAPSTGQVLSWDGGSWAPSSVADIVSDTIIDVGNSDYAVGTVDSSTFLNMHGLTANRTITLPASPTSAQKVLVKDTDGSLSTRNIIISGNGKNIDGASSFTLSNIQGPFSSLTIQYNGSSWSII
jgi:hypothetical protein